MAADSSSKPTQSNSTSIYQKLLLQVDAFDKAISGYLFRLSLPTIVEAVYSVPANFFGLVPSLAIGPLWVALLAFEDDIHEWQNGKILLLKSTTLLLTAVFLIAWALFQNGSMPLTKIMARKHFYLIAIFFNIGLLSYTLSGLPSDDPHAASSQKAYSHAIYLLFLWPPSILVIVILKKFSQRPRPIIVDMAKDKDQWLTKKSFPNICHFLAKAQAKESFPSGDATSAAIFAIVLMEVSKRYTTTGGQPAGGRDPCRCLRNGVGDLRYAMVASIGQHCVLGNLCADDYEKQTKGW
eukprot:CAMPEP_0116154250 /NCGR_PEP_ID=MMETSP0329-20121206/21679_1 /TAXON_ID=697910 /ORGANISM="Pseudo-nitzschia arenysensis, Strain B593" /LENGTH=294 /DNA_ID=CAMNT_0003651215 /DNA_START=131 /DNA_END=1012 /DNA_ORIENTATION=+